MTDKIKGEVERMRFSKEQKYDVIARATKVGCGILLLPMGYTLKFTSGGIKYTIHREREE